MSENKPAPEPPIAVSAEEKVATLRRDLVEAMTSELGPRMARVAVFGPDISMEDAEVYSRATAPDAGLAQAALDYVRWREANPVRLEDLMNDPENPRQAAPGHPAPWPPEWEVTRVAVAQGGDPFHADVVIEATCHADYGGGSSGPGSFPVQRLGALIAAAPEMEALLRDAEWVTHEGDEGAPPAFCFSCDRTEYDGHAADCKLAALLARIDAAKAAG